jgi:ribA/ribD-fused uncharacterized protein
MIQFRGELNFLSNFYPFPVKYDNKLYRDVESAFQAAKTLDISWRERIRQTSSPSEAKKLGRRCPMREDWKDIRVFVMFGLLLQKFKNPEMKRLLKKVDDSHLIELNDWCDNYWGDCTCIKCYEKIEGKNVLGLLLRIVKRMV